MRFTPQSITAIEAHPSIPSPSTPITYILTTLAQPAFPYTRILLNERKTVCENVKSTSLTLP